MINFSTLDADYSVLYSANSRYCTLDAVPVPVPPVPVPRTEPKIIRMQYSITVPVPEAGYSKSVYLLAHYPSTVPARYTDGKKYRADNVSKFLRYVR